MEKKAGAGAAVDEEELGRILPAPSTTTNSESGGGSGSSCGSATSMMAACSLDYDKIQTLSPSRTTVRDAFEWDDSGFSLASSEMDQVRESLFEAMRSG